MDISFVLVEPRVPENIGAAARAIKTMGFRRLVLVNPCEYNEGKARWLAHGSGDILDEAEVFASLENALEAYDFIIGTTSKGRISKHEYIAIEQLGTFLKNREEEYKKIALVFGREESGLTNEELKLCDIASTVPMAGAFPSLNLSQAVMLYAFSLHESSEESKASHVEKQEPASLGILKEKAERLLEGTDIVKNKTLKGRIMERLSMASITDIKLLHSVTNSLMEKYEEGEK
ncbi:MAG: tRNA/rRNA methyltransferase [Bacteroidota bacterium]